ncbi:alpha/beta hydrolase [Streptomyces sp. GMR22]|uniref:alpha/beta hydrolase n=1 Tax=Streptomyces sp. GMR22 TaxID=2759524 RepID=UPI0015FCEB18|nr:alpha/beta hydrolase fold domain-containing protein [Streptomyces sp. GMR22]MBA6439628.1 alpha/beta hydrolase [Streptomyces sp. GMR22]
MGGATAGAAAEERSVLGLAPVDPARTAAYGEHPDQVVDFYLPPPGTDGAARPAPLVLLFHGGAWRAPYDRRHVSPFAAFLAGRGLAVASVEYRRGGADPARAGRWPETFDDIAAAVDTVPGLARELGLPGVDPDRVVLTGHSAGGHAVLWAAARHRLPSGTPWHLASPSPLRGVVALAPIADLATARALDVCSGAVDELLGEGDSEGGGSDSGDGEGAVGGDELTVRLGLADPAALLPTAIPTTIVQGGTDIDVPPAVADAFAEAAARAGQDVRLIRTDGGHFPPIDPTTPAAHTVAEEIARLAGAHPT